MIWIAAPIASLLFLLLTIELVRRRKLLNDYAFPWIACSCVLVVLCLFRGILDVVAAWLGIYYPPMVLLLVLGSFVFLSSLSFSVIVSRQRWQIERLSEQVAVLSTLMREQMATEQTEQADRRSGGDGVG